jgi:hypothetical protein
MRRAQSGARRRLAWGLVLFVAGQMGLLLALDLAWPLLRFPSLAMRLGRLAEAEAGPDVVMLGSSRLVGALKEDEASRLLRGLAGHTGRVVVADCAFCAGDLRTQEYVLGQIHEMGARPRVVVLEVAPDLLCPDAITRGAWVGRHLRGVDLPRVPPEDIPDVLSRAPRCLALPVFYYRDSLSRQAWSLLASGRTSFPPARPTPAWGGKRDGLAPPEAPDWRVLLEEPPGPPNSPQREAMVRHIDSSVRRALGVWRVSAPAVEALERTARQCREAGSEVVLLEAPVTAEYRAAIPPGRREEYLAYLDGLCAQTGATFIDASAWLPDRLFKDSHHIDDTALPYFSRLLVRRVIHPAWARASMAGGLMAAH